MVIVYYQQETHCQNYSADGGGRWVFPVTVYLPPAETLTFGLETFSAARFFRRLQQ